MEEKFQLNLRPKKVACLGGLEADGKAAGNMVRAVERAQNQIIRRLGRKNVHCECGHAFKVTEAAILMRGGSEAPMVFCPRCRRMF